MYVSAHEPISALQRQLKLKSRQAIARRLQIIILARQGQTAPQVAAAVGMSRRQVQEWVRRYNAQGIEGLQDRPRTGQPPKLPRHQEEAFRQRFCAGPQREQDGGVCTLRGRDARRILRQEFGACYSLGGAIELLHRLGLSCLKPRPRHRHNDPQAMLRWRQDAPLLSSG